MARKHHELENNNPFASPVNKELTAINKKFRSFPQTTPNLAQLKGTCDKWKVRCQNPVIEIIICKSKSRTLVEYTLRDVNKPMGISTYTTGSSLPKNVQGLLPTPEEIAKHLKVFDTNEDWKY